jgi:hypothetical protein
MTNIFFYLFKRNNNNPQITKEEAGDNKFWMLGNNEADDEFVDAFCQTQQIYFGFSKLATIYKHKKATIKNTHDLGLNPITRIHPRKTIVFLQDGSLYAMHLSELINIINVALSYTNAFFILGIYPAKNPYTNVSFSNATLYNIYFAIKQSDYKMPPLFHAFFMCHFNIHQFSSMNRHCILEYAIDRYTYNTHSSILYPVVINLLSGNILTQQLNISPDFPQETLVNIMRPYLHMFFRGQYSNLVDEYWIQLMADLTEMLYDFYTYNPQFGRKHIHIKRKPPHPKITFNTSHPTIGRMVHPSLFVSFC